MNIGRKCAFLFVVFFVSLLGNFSEPADSMSVNETYVDVSINGKRYQKSGLVVDDRVYVGMDTVADSVGGQYHFDEQRGVASVRTGVFLGLHMDAFVQLNREVHRWYRPWAADDGDTVIHSAPGASLNIIATKAGDIVGFQLHVSADMYGYYPWFDQPEDEPLVDDEGYRYYTQHLFVVDQTGLYGDKGPRDELRIVMNGVPFTVHQEAFIWTGHELYVRLRDLAEKTGGGVGWDVATRTASAKIVSGDDLTLERLMGMNEASAHYRLVGAFVPGVGYYYDVPGPGITVTYDGDGRVTGFATLFDLAATGWERWFDQPEGRPEMFPTIGPRYSIHHYVVASDTIAAP